MQRCRETAEIVLAGSEIRPEVIPELCEIDFGQWEGLRFDELPRTARKDIARWAESDPDFCFPGGEKLSDFVFRVEKAAQLIISAEGNSIAAITHGGVIRLLICCLLGLPVRNYLLFEPQPASLTVINLFSTGKGTLAALIPCSSDGK
jgi:alpha-ribazole phosphatase/probable phosphoglycerate mutase